MAKIKVFGAPFPALRRRWRPVQCRVRTELCMYEKLPFHFDIFNKTHVLAFGDVDKHTNERRTCFGQ